MYLITYLKTSVSAPLFNFLRFSDYYILAEGSLPAKLCLVQLLNSEKVRNLKDSATTRSNGKQNVQFQKTIEWQICQGEQGYPHTSLMFPFPSF